MPNAIIMAGGTGGHIFPALAVANELKQQGWTINWLGTQDRLEATLVPQQGYPIHFLPIKGLRGKGVLAKLHNVLAIVKSIFVAHTVIRETNADVVLGFGGYPSFPGGIAAKLLRKPIIIHEQNAVAGLSNKVLGKIAKQVFIGFPSAENDFGLARDRIHFVGNPVRTDIVTKTPKNIHVSSSDSYTFKLLVLGGSLGAQALNEQVPFIIGSLAQKDKLSVVHQCGKGREMEVSAHYLKVGMHANVREFIDDMAGAYEWADAVVCRAGALTVSEVATAGVTACFVPLPHAFDDHQTKNAQYLASRDAGLVIAQHTLDEQLAPLLTQWIANPEACWQMGARATRCFPNNATKAIVDACKPFLKES